MQLIHITVIIVLWVNVYGNEINNTAPSEINPQYLIDVGVKTNDAKLEAIGIAMKNLHINMCTVWSTWSKCTSNMFGYFGTKRRFRKCLNETETDLTLCRHRCPNDYQTTENGFCIRVHSAPKLRSEAQKQCMSEGGYLVKINSQEKYDDIKNLNLPNNFTNYFLIGGGRKDSRSPWTFQDGTRMTFFRWGTNQPNNKSSTELCLYLYWNSKLMVDAHCPQKFPYLCEFNVSP